MSHPDRNELDAVLAAVKAWPGSGGACGERSDYQPWASGMRGSFTLRTALIFFGSGSASALFRVSLFDLEPVSSSRPTACRGPRVETPLVQRSPALPGHALTASSTRPRWVRSARLPARDFATRRCTTRSRSWFLRYYFT